MLARLWNWVSQRCDDEIDFDPARPPPTMAQVFEMPLRVYGPDSGRCVIIDANNFEVVGLLTRDRANAVLRAINAQHERENRAERERIALLQYGSGSL